MKIGIKKLALSISVFATASIAFAQPSGPIPAMNGGVVDAPVMQQHVPTKKVIPYAHLREADYIWGKRVWRTIDLREKQNYPLYYPLIPLNDRWSLWDILRVNIEEGNITPFLVSDPDDLEAPNDGDQFKYPLVQGQTANYNGLVKSLFNIEIVSDEPRDSLNGYDEWGDPIYVLDALGDRIQIIDTSYIAIEAQEIIEYHIKEDWIFDKQRSVLDVRIEGIAPVTYLKEGDAIVGKTEKFWVYFPECRYVFQNYFVYNEHNDARRMSFDDLFWKRKFQSYIHKETNVYDREINDHKVGVDALLKSEDIKYQIFKFEHDVWHF